MTTRRNNRLPFDVLAPIFEYYAEEETRKYPLETLLLVCQSWRDSALAHHALWGNLNVIFRGNDDSGLHLSRVSRRIKRSGEGSPFYIRIEGEYNSIMFPPRSHEAEFNCSNTPRPLVCCGYQARRLIWDSLALIAGKSGELCARWKTFSLEPRISIFIGLGGPIAALRYPTPSLVSIKLTATVYSHPILPFCPSLRYISLINTTMETVPDISHTEEVVLRFTRIPHFNLAMAKHLRRLNLDVGHLASSETLSYSFPHLTHLSFKGHWCFLLSIQVPNLRHLALGINDTLDVFDIPKCRGIPFSNLQELTLERFGSDFARDYWYQDALRGLLSNTTSSLTRITADSYTMTYIFNLLFKSRIKPHVVVRGQGAVRPFLDGEVLLRIFDKNGGVGVQAVVSSDVSSEWIVETADKMGLAPLNTDQELISKFFLNGENRHPHVYQTNSPARRIAYFTAWDS